LDAVVEVHHAAGEPALVEELEREPYAVRE
jgi:hypothetical protein